MAKGAIFHCDVSTISRASGRSSVAAAAYRAGTVLDDERTGLRFDYTKKKNVLDSFIVAPDGAGWISDRETLWNAAEMAENRKNSVTAREWMIALPDALDAAQQAELARAFAVELATRFGVAVDVAIHTASVEGDKRNKHAHLLTTTRIAGPDGLGEKTRVLDAAKTGGVEIANMRKWWAGTVNDALAAAQSEARVDHRRKSVVAAEKQELAEALEAQATNVATLKAKPAEVGGLWAGLGHAARAFRSSGLAAFFSTGVTVEKLKAKALELRRDVERLSKPPAVHRGPALNAFVRRREAAEARVRAAEKREKADAIRAALSGAAASLRASLDERPDPRDTAALPDHKREKALRDEREAAERAERDRDHYAGIILPLIQRARKDSDFADLFVEHGIDLNRSDRDIARDERWPMRGAGFDGSKTFVDSITTGARWIDKDREPQLPKQEAAQRPAPIPSPAPERPKPQAPRPKSGGNGPSGP